MSEVKAVTLADKLALAEQLKIPARKAVEKSHEMDKGIVGQYNGDFPLSTATINNVYYFPNNRKYYRCIADYNGVELTQPNTENFKELSFLELEKSVDGAMPLIQADIKKYNDNVTAKKQELSTTAEQEKAKVTAEGGKQVGLVNSEATKVTEQLRSLVEGNPETSNALSLSGKSRLEFEKETQGVAGGYAGKFPLTSAVKDGIYLLPETGKFYVCNQEFKDKSLIVPDSTFEELSVWKNKSKLENMCNLKTVTFQLNEVNLILQKIGKIVVAKITHHGGKGVVDYSKSTFVPKEFIPRDSSIHLPIASETGSPYLVITYQGEIIIRINGATIQTENLNTAFFSNGVYIAS